MTPWLCRGCGSEQSQELVCALCSTLRFPSLAVMLAEHVTEHMADGLSTPLEVLTAMQSRGCYASFPLDLAFVAQQMRLLTKDTTTLARQIAKARASRTMLEILEHGDMKDKTAILKGIQVLGDVVEHKGEVSTVVKHIYETAGPVKEGA